MNLSIAKKRVSVPLRGLANRRRGTLASIAGGLSLSLLYAGHAFAQATSPAGGIGAQLNLMSSEGLNSGSTAFGMGCYLAAAVMFLWGGWSLWQSRQPQNREGGHVTRGIAGVVLCGLLASAGVWINKAAVSTSGGNATINTTPQMVQFGAGG